MNRKLLQDRYAITEENYVPLATRNLVPLLRVIENIDLTPVDVREQYSYQGKYVINLETQEIALQLNPEVEEYSYNIVRNVWKDIAHNNFTGGYISVYMQDGKLKIQLQGSLYHYNMTLGNPTDHELAVELLKKSFAGKIKFNIEYRIMKRSIDNKKLAAYDNKKYTPKERFKNLMTYFVGTGTKREFSVKYLLNTQTSEVSFFHLENEDPSAISIARNTWPNFDAAYLTGGIMQISAYAAEEYTVFAHGSTLAFDENIVKPEKLRLAEDIVLGYLKERNISARRIDAPQ